MHKQEASILFKALSEPNRVKIVKVLYHNKEFCVNELLNKVDCGQSTLCFHLKTLVNVNLLRQRKDGRKTYYSCNKELVDQLMSFIPTRCKCMG